MNSPSPFDPQLLADYDYFCRRFGAMPLPEFIELWQAAGELLDASADALGPELFLTADSPP